MEDACMYFIAVFPNHYENWEVALEKQKFIEVLIGGDENITEVYNYMKQLPEQDSKKYTIIDHILLPNDYWLAESVLTHCYRKQHIKDELHRFTKYDIEMISNYRYILGIIYEQAEKIGTNDPERADKP